MSEVFSQGYALVVGVGADLPNTINDVQGIADILRDSGRCAYPVDQVHLLIGQKANRDGILAAFDTLAEQADEEALSATVMQRYHVNTAIKRDLGSKLGSRKGVSSTKAENAQVKVS